MYKEITVLLGLLGLSIFLKLLASTRYGSIKNGWDKELFKKGLWDSLTVFIIIMGITYISTFIPLEIEGMDIVAYINALLIGAIGYNSIKALKKVTDIIGYQHQEEKGE